MVKNSEKKNSLKGLEKNIEKLEQVVSQLESGELSLDASIVKFEEGVKLYKDCKMNLSTAEKKIVQLTESLKEVDLEMS